MYVEKGDHILFFFFFGFFMLALEILAVEMSVFSLVVMLCWENPFWAEADHFLIFFAATPQVATGQLEQG